MTHTGQTVVITGAGGGMGAACCARLQAGGWHVIGIDRYTDGLPSAGERLTFLAGEVRDPALPERVLGALRACPPVTGLVNMVGASIGDRIEQLSDDAWDESFAVNVTPAMRLIRALAPEMKARGGSVVNVGSPVGVIGARKPSYAASKAALHGLTMACARNLGGDGIRVNLLLPGPAITRMTGDWDDGKRAAIARASFLGRLCRPEEVAAVVSFLLGPDSSYMTGSVIDMTSGSMYGH